MNGCFKLPVVTRFLGIKVSLHRLYMGTMKAPPSYMENVKLYIQVCWVEKCFLQETREQVTFFVGFLHYACNKEAIISVAIPKYQAIIIIVIANDLQGLQNHHGIIRGVLYLLYISVLTESCQSQA